MSLSCWLYFILSCECKAGLKSQPRVFCVFSSGLVPGQAVQRNLAINCPTLPRMPASTRLLICTHNIPTANPKPTPKLLHRTNTASAVRRLYCRLGAPALPTQQQCWPSVANRRPCAAEQPPTSTPPGASRQLHRVPLHLCPLLLHRKVLVLEGPRPPDGALHERGKRLAGLAAWQPVQRVDGTQAAAQHLLVPVHLQQQQEKKKQKTTHVRGSTHATGVASRAAAASLLCRSALSTQQAFTHTVCERRLSQLAQVRDATHAVPTSSCTCASPCAAACLCPPSSHHTRPSHLLLDGVALDLLRESFLERLNQLVQLRQHNIGATCSVQQTHNNTQHHKS